MRSVVAVVGERVAAFELGIVSQVFGLDRSDDGLPVYDFAVCGAEPGEVPTTSGFPVRVVGLDKVAEADLVTVPAWPTLDAPVDPAVLDVLRAAVERGARVLSVCSGAFAMAAAGLLDGRRAATHWQFADLLARRYPTVHVDRDVLYVTDGPILTSAGAAAGIDACLHLVRETHGTQTANELARRMVIPPHRDGGQAQFVDHPMSTTASDTDLAELLDWMSANLSDPQPVSALAARAVMSERTFARRFRATTGTTPHRWLLDQRLRRAEELLESTDLPVDRVAAESGLGAGDTLRHHFTTRRGVSPAVYRRTFQN